MTGCPGAVRQDERGLGGGPDIPPQTLAERMSELRKLAID